jgi:hypothetical protein
MKSIHLPLSFAILTLVSINFISVTSCLAQNTLNSDEFSIYSTLLQIWSTGDKNQELVIKNKTFVDDININQIDKSKYLIKQMPSLSKEIIDNFSSRNSKPIKIEDKFNLKLKVNVVGEELDQIFNNSLQQSTKMEAWGVFREKNPKANGFITISRVGFNKEKTQAFAYVARHCDVLCGSSWYYFLVKRNDKWTLQERLNAWVS